MANIGDYVRFLNDVGGGRITRINGQTAYVTDSDGFEQPVLLRECVVVPAPTAKSEESSRPAEAPASKQSRVVENPAPAATVENPEGDKLTALLLFEPHDIKRLSVSALDVVLVNDSNYHLLYNVATRDRSDAQWTLFGAGTVEPNTQILLDEIELEDFHCLERISVQLSAYKPAKEFELKPPVVADVRFDVTKLAKLHCYARTPYSDTPVVTLPLISADEPARPLDLSAIKMEAPKPADRPKPQPKAAKTDYSEPQVIDLHIDELVDSTAGLSHTDMLHRQLDEFDRHMKEAMRHPGAKLIFIHGKGEGVLRQALLDRLRRQYPRCEAQDASFREYGFGATQITIHR